MKKTLIFFIILLSTITITITAKADAKFPWECFVPIISGPGAKPDKCDSGHISLCMDKNSCINHSGLWYDNYCHEALSCSTIAGIYSGNMSDNCYDYQVNGVINVAIYSDCSFFAASEYGVFIKGAIRRDDNNLIGYGKTSSNGCGGMKISCAYNGLSNSENYNGVRYLCDYKYDVKGGNGTISSLEFNPLLNSCPNLPCVDIWP